MDREQAIKILNNLTFNMDFEDGTYEKEIDDIENAINMAIEALAIPSAYKGMTNGEVIKTVFPNIPRTLEWHIQNITDDDWWNSPYEPQERRRMTLDEAIKRYTRNAEYERTHGSLQGCLEFRQLAEWLKDYKRLLEQEPQKGAIRNDR